MLWWETFGFMHLIAQSGRIQDESYEKAMSKMMKGLWKTISKTFKCYQQTCKLLIKDGSPDSVFGSNFLKIATESHFKIRSNGKHVLWAGNMGKWSS